MDGAAGGAESSTNVSGSEHADVLPTASVAVARRTVVALAGTPIASPPAPNAAAGPSAAGAPAQAPENTRTMEPGSAAPVTRTAAARAGEPGIVPVSAGGAGAVESSTNVSAPEQADVLPARSEAVARKALVVSLPTGTVRPGEASSAADPVAS